MKVAFTRVSHAINGLFTASNFADTAEDEDDSIQTY
jgi:hypothetical protein